MSLEDELRGDSQQLSRDRAESMALQAELLRSRAELDRALEVNTLIDRFKQDNLHVPAWTRRVRKKAVHRGIATLQLSDTHFDEVVMPNQVSGYNAYNRAIGLLRLNTLGEKAIEVGRELFAGVEYDGLVVLATGDIFSGDIHEELRRTNAAPLYASVAYWVGPMVAWLRFLADDYGKVHLHAVVGNHGRNTHKPIYKDRAQNNIEWLFWHYVADTIAAMGDKRITFEIADGLSTVATVYSTRYEMEHGDEFRGGGGISGAKAPLMLGQHRTAVKQLAMDQPLDWMVVGHFHQGQLPGQGLIMGGSLKGYDEYAAGKHFRPEVPQQTFWVTTPERGPTVAAFLQPMNRKREGW